MRQLSKEEAIELAESGKWKDWPDRALVGFQLSQKKMCVDFSAFHAAIERVLDRPVYSHEFGLNFDGLVAEFLGESPKPSFKDIMDMIPEDKRIIICL